MKNVGGVMNQERDYVVHPSQNAVLVVMLCDSRHRMSMLYLIVRSFGSTSHVPRRVQ